jgi:PAS domain S-box-containing protein
MKESFSESTDFKIVKEILEGFGNSTGIKISVRDRDGKLLSGTDWSQVCTGFHQKNPKTSSGCVISGRALAGRINDGEKYHFHACSDGLVCAMAPIVIGGEHLADLFTEQFFPELPDVTVLKSQAKINGFDEIKYLKAIGNVSVYSRKRVESTLDFLLYIINLIGDLDFQGKERHGMISATLQSLGEALISTNMKSQISMMNPVAEALTGWSLTEARGKHIDDIFRIFNSQTGEKAVNPVDRSLKEGVIVGLANHTKLISRNGKEYQIADSCAPIKDDRGRILGAVLVFRDVTDEYEKRERLVINDQAIRNSVNGIAIADLSGSLTFVNDSFVRLWGYSRVEEVLGRQASDFWNIREEAEEVIRKIGASGYFTGEMKCKKADGSMADLHLSASIIIGSDGSPVAMFGSFIDITAQKRAEKELAHSNDLLKYIIEHTRSSVAVHDTDMNYIYVSKRYNKDMHLADRDIIGCNHYDIFPGLPEYIKAAHKRAINGEVISAEGEPMYWPDGSIDWADWQCRPWYKADGSTGGIIIYIEVITDRKLAKEELQKHQRLISDMGTIAKIGGWEFDALTGKGTWTEETARIHDLDPSDPTNVEKGISFYKPDSRAKIEQAIKEAIEEAKPYDLELEIISASGVEKWVQTIGHPVSENGKVIKVGGSFQDITYRKRIEADLVAAKEKAEESDRLKTAFLNNISHEIRTPMNAIVGFSTLLTDADLTDNSKDSFVNTIIQSSNQLLAIINDIVDISNVEAGIIKLSLEPVMINDILRRQGEVFSLNANEKEINLHITLPLPDNDTVISTDKTKLTQVLTNLLNNAFKFTTEGTIECGYKINNQFIEFYVSDTGIGIPEDQIARVFDRFYQVDYQLSRIYQGTGIGLSICKAYVELMGGKIWVESEPGKGTVFHFTLPYNNSTEKISEVVVRKEASLFRGEYHILVAEDDELNLTLLKKYLLVPGLKAKFVTNGQEAVSYCTSGEQIDLVLLDLKMPVINGFEAARIIRNHLPEVPIIAQTAYAIPEDRERALSAGCIDLITKPFRRESLLIKIKEHLKD